MGSSGGFQGCFGDVFFFLGGEGIAECSVFRALVHSRRKWKEKSNFLKVQQGSRFVYLPCPSTHISFLNKMLSWRSLGSHQPGLYWSENKTTLKTIMLKWWIITIVVIWWVVTLLHFFIIAFDVRRMQVLILGILCYYVIEHWGVTTDLFSKFYLSLRLSKWLCKNNKISKRVTNTFKITIKDKLAFEPQISPCYIISLKSYNLQCIATNLQLISVIL